MKKVEVRAQKPYDALIENGLLDRAGELCKGALKAQKIMLVTDDVVDVLYAERVEKSLKEAFGEKNVAKFVIPHGEENKTPQMCLRIVEEMAGFGLTRSDAVVALGGGVVGDIAGFAAATYMRGIDIVQIPTSLLAMIDSAVGGKTGVDLPQGKNLMGAFHSPKLVIVDPSVADTLPESEYENGLGEGVKYAVMDRNIAPFLLNNRVDKENFVCECLKLKAKIVSGDEFESGERRLLNLGHTVGHAIEKCSGFAVAHGIAVAMGVCVMTRAALSAGEISRERAAEIYDLAKLACVNRTFVDANRIAPFVAVDKKAEGREVNAVVVTQNGCELRKFEIDEFLRYVAKTDLKIQNSVLKGEAVAPASKSATHRESIAEFLAGGPFEAEGGADVQATTACLQAMSLAKKYGDDSPVLYAGESGSTLRFLAPVACALGLKAKFVCEGRLRERPLEGLVQTLEEHGAKLKRNANGDTEIIEARLSAGRYVVDGSVSSQYVTGLLFALPLLDGDSTLEVVGKAASTGYIQMTLRTLKKFGIEIKKTDEKFFIRGGQKYVMPKEREIEGDWSSAGFLLVAGALAGEVRVTGLDKNSAQSDRIIVDLLRRAGADISEENGAFVAKKSQLSHIDFDAADCPDVVPVMATALSFADGESHISSVNRLKTKESDRLQAIRELLFSFGVETRCENDVLTVFGKKCHLAGEYPTFCDHRIAMSAAVAAMATKGVSVIKGAECASKSYVNFFADLKRLGAKIERVGRE